jgi:LysR family transcriptional regulator, glycine cleavage system transcriptional activator
MRRLPPFAELVAFEAVARHQSFTRAASELCITQSAVSHRVRRLEKHFGTTLIQRLNPGVRLTDAGEALLADLVQLLNGLEELGARRERRLRVAAAGAMCNWWLTRRLPAFMKVRPGLSIELVPIDNVSTPIPHVDVRILWLDDREKGTRSTQTQLATEQMLPVCAPQLLPDRRLPVAASALPAMPLLHKASQGASHGTGEWSWSVWFDHLGLGRYKRRGGELRFTDPGLLLGAAVDGAGVALGRSLLVHDALADGRLVIPIGGFEPIASTRKHVVRWRRAASDDADVQAFVAWLVAQGEATVTATDQMLRARQARTLHAVG